MENNNAKLSADEYYRNKEPNVTLVTIAAIVGIVGIISISSVLAFFNINGGVACTALTGQRKN